MTITKISCYFFVFIIFYSSVSDFAFGQNGVAIQDEPIKRIDEINNLLSTTVTATLAGLSLAASAFLVKTLKDQEDETMSNPRKAQKDFIKAFFLFLVCTISIFVFDFLEIISIKLSLYVMVSGLIIKYGLFGVGILYLIKSAREVRISYGK